jgi:hypothetical protein
MNTKTALLALAALALAAPALAQMPPAQAWDIGPWVQGRNYSEGMPAHPSPTPNGLSFAFPIAGRGQVDAMTTGVGPLAGAHRITMRYRIDAAPGTRFIPDVRPGETATVSLYFPGRGDNWCARGRFGSYRWYVPARAVLPLEPGDHTVTIGFDEVWTNVNGVPNTQDPAGYQSALANTSMVGIAFGSAGRRSHGVYATGPAQFTLLALDIQ